MKLPFDYKGFTVAKSKDGGKAVKGTNRTATIQVREPSGSSGYFLKAQFRYTVESNGEFLAAVEKAQKWIDDFVLK